MPSSSRNSRRSASISDSPPSTPPPGSSQYSLPGFSWRQSRTRSCQRRIAETRMRGSISGVKSRNRGRHARSRAARRRSTSSTSGSSRITSCAIRMPGSTTKVVARVGVDEVDEQLAAVAGVDEARRVDDRDAVLGGEARTWLHEARMALGDRDREPGAARAPARPGRSSTRSQAERSRPASPGIGPHRHDGVRSAASE